MTAPADEGVSLLTIVGESGRKRLDELSVARVIAEVAEALDHENGSAPPIQPTSILISRTGTVRVDGKSAGPDEEIAYTAPERLRGEAGDHRSDVFSLGVVMWEALTHARLFEGLTEDAIKEAVLADEVSAPSTRNANIPGELDMICLRALARDPASRYPTAKAMAVEIEGVLRDASYGRANDAIGTFVSTLPKELFRKAVAAKPSLPEPKTAPKIGTQTMIGFPQPKLPAETVPMPGLNQSVPTVPLAPLSDTAPGLGSPVLKPPAEVAKVIESAKGVPVVDAPPPAKSVDTVMGIGRLVEVLPDEPIQPAVDGPAVVLLPKPPILPTSLLVPKVPKPEGPHVVPAHIAAAPTQIVAPVSAVEVDDKPARASSPNEFEDEPSASPVEPPANDSSTGGRDVLAGWAWQTGGQAAIDDDDDIAVPPPSRRPLFIAIGGAVAVLGIIAIVAFAGGGSKTDDDKQPVAKPQVATVDPTPAPPPDPKPDPGSAATPTGSATDPAGSAGTTTNPIDTTNPSATTTPPTTTDTTTTPPAPTGATTTTPPPTAATPPATGATTATTGATTATTGATTNPPAVTTTTPPTTPPPTATTTKAATKPPEPPKKVDPPKVAKVDPPKKNADPPKKIDPPKKKVDPKPPRVATAPVKARPVDPYPDAKPDAETSYRNGVQAFARGDTSAALISLRSALDANPRFAPTSRALGLVYEKLGERNQAVRAYRRYLQLAPGAGDADQIRSRLERLGS